MRVRHCKGALSQLAFPFTLCFVATWPAFALQQWSSFVTGMVALLGVEPADALFHLLGYYRRGHVFQLADGRPSASCPDAAPLLELAVDCFLAQVECQIVDSVMAQHRAESTTGASVFLLPFRRRSCLVDLPLALQTSRVGKRSSTAATALSATSLSSLVN